MVVLIHHKGLSKHPLRDRMKAVITPVEKTVFPWAEILSTVRGTVSLPWQINQPITPLMTAFITPLTNAFF
jgi:hypothetical protein